MARELEITRKIVSFHRFESDANKLKYNTIQLKREGEERKEKKRKEKKRKGKRKQKR